LMNSGGVRQALPAGRATYGTLFEIQPFANTFVRVRVRGADLRAFFQRALARGAPNFHISGVRILYHAGPPAAIDSFTVGGTPVNDQAVYTVVQSNFTSTGGDDLGFGAAALTTDAVGITDLDGLIQYLKSIPQPVPAPRDQRLVRRP